MESNQSDLIDKAFQRLNDSIDLLPHQQRFCETEQDLVFFGGK